MAFETSINIISILILLGGLSGLMLPLLLLIKNNNKANRYLALFLVSLGLILLHQFLIISGYISYVAILTGIILPLEFILPPALYLYIRTLSITDFTIKKVSWHFLPAIMGTLLVLPFYTLSFNTKLMIIKSNFESMMLPGLFHFTFPVFVTATGLQLVIYLFLYFKLLFSHQRNIKQVFSSEKNYSLLWLRYFLVLLLVFWFVMMLLYQVNNLFFTDSWLYVLGLVVIMYLGIMGMLQPVVYQQEDYEWISRVINLKNLKTSQQYYQNSSVGFEESSRIIKNLTEIMESNKPFLQKTLNLSELAELVSVSPEMLSQVINERLNMSFFVYVNSYRKRQ